MSWEVSNDVDTGSRINITICSWYVYVCNQCRYRKQQQQVVGLPNDVSSAFLSNDDVIMISFTSLYIGIMDLRYEYL